MVLLASLDSWPVWDCSLDCVSLLCLPSSETLNPDNAVLFSEKLPLLSSLPPFLPFSISFFFLWPGH